MDTGHLKISDGGEAPYHPEDGASVAVNYEHIAVARSRALRAFARAQQPAEDDAARIANLEAGVRELSDAVVALVNLLTEVVSGFDERDLHVVNYPEEQAYQVRPS